MPILSRKVELGRLVPAVIFPCDVRFLKIWGLTASMSLESQAYCFTLMLQVMLFKASSFVLAESKLLFGPHSPKNPKLLGYLHDCCLWAKLIASNFATGTD
jgi:hypothetical protein